MARRRVNGPYRHRNKWRYVIVNESGAQSVFSCDTEEEARKEADEARKLIEQDEGIKVTEALDAYEIYLRDVKKNKPRSIETTRGRVARLLEPVVDRPVVAITESAAERCYAVLMPKVSTDYHRNSLNETKTFFRWMVAKPQKWIKKSAFEGVKPLGKRKKGKPQLYIDESRKFVETAKALADRGDVAGIVALGALYFGTRITELVSRSVRDLDDGGHVLQIPDSKTENGKRALDVPEDLRAYLLALAKDKLPGAPLFVGPRKGKPISRYTAYDMVKKVCRRAGVPEVSPHGLRGTHGTIARERGVTPSVVAAALGHGSYDAVTAQHYVAAGTDDRVRQAQALGVLNGGKK